MASLGLLDIAPPKHTVKVGTKDLPVSGISARSIADLLARFPDLEKAIGMPMIDADAAAERAVLFRKVAPDAISAIIAAATGNHGDARAEAIAESLPLETQMDILEATFKLTFPSGVGPFVRRLQALTGTGPAPAPAVPTFATGKARDTTSPTPRRNSAQHETQPSST
jgi:hypothetical protein